MKYFLLLTCFLFFSASCSVSQEPIKYGEDNCAHCQMKIMDARYGSELVTDKGKVYKFDSVECLVEFLEKMDELNEKAELVFCTPFDQPNRLVDASACSFLHSRKLPSPMGMYLSAFADEPTALKFQSQNGGNVYSWKELNKEFDKLRKAGAPE
jgi:copper chaperone NosL